MSVHERNYGIDAVRWIAIIFVVFQHACGNTIVEKNVEAIAKVAVPLFFMITGFYYKQTATAGKENKQIKKIFNYALVLSCIYVGIDIIVSLIKGSLIEYFKKAISIKALFQFVLFNDSVSGDHGWYLWALLYVLIIAKVFYRFNCMEAMESLGILFTLVFLLVGKYSLVFFEKQFYMGYSRNFLVIGIPYFCLGYYLNEKRNLIIKLKKLWLSLIFFFGLCVLAEYNILISVGKLGNGYYISTLPLALSAFCFFYTLQETKTLREIAKLGHNYSLFIYIFHSFFVRIEKKIFNMDNGFGWVGFAFVFGISFIGAVCYSKIQKIYKNYVGI